MKGKGRGGKNKPCNKGQVSCIRVQRKIHHLLASQGLGDTFQYLTTFSEKTGFSHGDRVYLTEKWDGTTVQATKDGVYKRLDKFCVGDPRKHSATEEERYDLVLLDLDKPHNQFIKKAVQPYLHIFQELPEGLCVYFEAFGTQIGSRFCDIPDMYDIRVFDFSRRPDDEEADKNDTRDSFLSFEETIVLCDVYALPMVHYFEFDLSVPKLMSMLRQGKNYHDKAAPLEGYVIRDVEEGLRVAKIRVEDLPKISKGK